jgi:hypothetical protein
MRRAFVLAISIFAALRRVQLDQAAIARREGLPA